ncbi:MAG: membrane protein insertion efficiency factor YidD [Patescibacteria group bacterium]|nr:membrane protein insertion efficiency factor YidD [Patescibacteria group bacterium]
MKYLLLGVIKFYRVFFSPQTGLFKNFYFFPAHCHFEHEESCSLFAYNAINKYGCFKGLKMAFLRFCRCSGFIK